MTDRIRHTIGGFLAVRRRQTVSVYALSMRMGLADDGTTAASWIVLVPSDSLCRPAGAGSLVNSRGPDWWYREGHNTGERDGDLSLLMIYDWILEEGGSPGWPSSPTTRSLALM